MAYIDFTGTLAPAPIAIDAPRHDSLPAPERARLSPLEWSVIAIARRDRLSSLRTPGRLSIALGNLFGKGANPRLADPRLEALRRMAVLSWHHGFQVPASAVRAFIAAGFTQDQYETMLASISAAKMNTTARMA
ncbi:hypothetical protein [Sphingomonas sp.]|uniref:hypothetical protein n=1 Tax=Sphingomonas sp. TaxID=28214 RepID=UPI0035C81BFE